MTDERSMQTEAESLPERTRLATLIHTADEARHARLLIESLRTFGGRLSHCPVFEETFRYPETLQGLEVREPLRSWLMERTPGGV